MLSRNELQLLKLFGIENVETLPANSRIELILEKIRSQGINKLTDEQIKNALDKYLLENPLDGTVENGILKL